MRWMRVEAGWLVVMLWIFAGCGAPMRAQSDRALAFERLSADTETESDENDAPRWAPWEIRNLPVGELPSVAPGATLLTPSEIAALPRPPGSRQALAFTRQAQCLAEANLAFMNEHGKELWEPLATWVQARCGLTGYRVTTVWSAGSEAPPLMASASKLMPEVFWTKSVQQVARIYWSDELTWRPRDAPELDGINDMVIWPLSIARDHPERLRERVEDGYADNIIAYGEACRETEEGSWECCLVTEWIHPNLVMEAWPRTIEGDETIIRGWGGESAEVVDAYVSGPGLPGTQCRARHNMRNREFFVHCPVPPAGQAATIELRCMRAGYGGVRTCANLAWPGPEPESLSWEQVFSGLTTEQSPTSTSRADIEDDLIAVLNTERVRLGLPAAVHLRAQSSFLSDAMPVLRAWYSYRAASAEQYDIVQDVLGEGWAVPWDIGTVMNWRISGTFTSPEHFLQHVMMDARAGMVAFSPLVDGLAVGIQIDDPETGRLGVLLVGYQQVDPENLDAAAERVLEEAYRVRSTAGLQAVPESRGALRRFIASAAASLEAGRDPEAVRRIFYERRAGSFASCTLIAPLGGAGFPSTIFLIDREMAMRIGFSLIPATRRYEPWMLISIYGGCPG